MGRRAGSGDKNGNYIKRKWKTVKCATLLMNSIMLVE